MLTLREQIVLNKPFYYIKWTGHTREIYIIVDRNLPQQEQDARTACVYHVLLKHKGNININYNNN